VEDFVALHDVQGIGLAGELEAVDIFNGSPTYNEHAGLPDLQIAADGVASQWAAMQTIGDVLGDTGTAHDLASAASSEAKTRLAQFETSWWSDFRRPLHHRSVRQQPIEGFSLRSVVGFYGQADAPRQDAGKLHLGATRRLAATNPPRFLESTSYLPEAFFAFGFDDEALHWLRMLINSRWEYPEIPFTVISHLVSGLTGLEVATDARSRPVRIFRPANGWRFRNIPIRDGLLTIRQEGRNHTELTLSAASAASVPARWEARSTMRRHASSISNPAPPFD